MKRFYIITNLILVFLLINLNAQTGSKKETTAQPKIEIIGGDTYDWGLVSPKDSPLKTTITIKNAGDAMLIINQVKPACGCTSAPLTKSKLKPGDTTQIHVQLRIGNRASKVTKTIRISSNDPKTPHKIYYLKCKVFLPLEVSPTPYFTFNKMKVGEESSSVLKLKNNTKETVTLSDIQIKPEDLIFNVKNGTKIKPGESIDLKVRYKPHKAGYFSCSVRIKTTAKDMPQLYISGYGNVQESSIFNN